MKQFTAILHRGEPEEGGFWATCLEVPGANGQGETKEEGLRDLGEAIRLLLETEREEAFRPRSRRLRQQSSWHEAPGFARSYRGERRRIQKAEKTYNVQDSPAACGFEHFGFEFRVCFGFRISNFGFARALRTALRGLALAKVPG